MSLIVIVIPALLLYMGFVLWFVRRRYLPKYYVPAADAETAGGHYRLARIIRQILSTIHAFAFLALIVWIPMWLVMTVSQLGQPEWGADIEVYSGFTIDVELTPALEASGLRDPVIRGKTLLQLDTTNRLAWNLFAMFTLGTILVVLYLALQARNIFASLSNGETFTSTNSKRLSKIGVVVIAAYLVSPLLQYFGWGAVLNDLSVDTAVIRLYPAFELNPLGILIGLSMLVLSGVLKEAVEMKHEQTLTI